MAAEKSEHFVEPRVVAVGLCEPTVWGTSPSEIRWTIPPPSSVLRACGRSQQKRGLLPAVMFPASSVPKRPESCYAVVGDHGGDFNEDFADMLVALVEHEVDFMIVGAYALAVHGFPRATGDIDVLVRPTAENAERVFGALIAFGAPLQRHGVGKHDFARTGNVYQVGLPPRRIDLLTSISGVSFDEALKDAVTARLGVVDVRVIGREAMARNKRAAGRPKDLADAELLESDRTA